MENRDSKEDTNSPECVASAVRNLYETSDFSDVEIEAADGTKLSAHRSILGSRSPVFKQLLLGQFSEAQAPIVSLGFEGNILKSVLEYCYTDEFSGFICQETGKDSEESIIQMAMDVASAADYFALPKLCVKVLDWATDQMDKNPVLAWSFLVAAESSTNTNVWRDRACHIISNHSEKCMSLGQDRLGRVSYWALEQVASDDNIAVNETSLFALIASWRGVSNSKERKADAAGLVARHIHLDRMRASELAAIVRPSDLVTKNQLLDAYELVSARAESAGYDGAVLQQRGPQRSARWETSKGCNYQPTSNAYRRELLECNPMRSGKHKWSIKVTSYCKHVWIGLVCTNNSGVIDRTDPLGWAYGSNGAKRRAGWGGEFFSLPIFSVGDTVTFTLDLSGTVCLKACVNDGDENTIFDRNQLTPPYSFVPAVYLRNPGAVQFCGFLPV